MSHVLLEPSDHASCEIDRGGKTANAVAFLRVADQHGFGIALEEQRAMKLPRLLGRCASIESTADVERRRSYVVGMHDGTALEVLPGWIVVSAAEKQRHEVRNV